MLLKAFTFLLLSLAGAIDARGEAALFVGEPYGVFGHMNPTGHSAVYLSRVCAATPVKVRRCTPGELGVVISRYHRIGGYDWIAIPLIPYLYAVEDESQAPASADPAAVAQLRDQYRRAHLRDLIPDGPDGAMPPGDWVQLVGSSYDRTIYSFEISTTEAQDDALIEHLNSAKNRKRFHLFYRNCADFSRSILNFYYPHAVRRSIFADAGITTPKQVAKSLTAYSRKHEELRFTRFAIAQVPGTIPRSRKLRGVLESVIFSKKYITPVVFFHPIIAGSLAVSYLVQSGYDRTHHVLRNMERREQPEAVIAAFRPDSPRLASVPAGVPAAVE